jgi:hypothetical protein
MMMMHPGTERRSEIGSDGFLVAGGMAQHFAAFAYALVRLDMGTGGYLLQEHLHRLAALLALEGQETGWLGGHIDIAGNSKPAMIRDIFSPGIGPNAA